MKKIMPLLLALLLALAACASSGFQQDCLARKHRMDHIAKVGTTQLTRGLTTQEVRALLGEPVEIVTPSGVGPLEIWKYYVFADCKAQLGLSAPVTELFFLKGNLWNWSTYVP